MLLFLAGLLGQKNGLDVRENTSLGDGDALKQLVQLLVVADGQLQVTRVDARFLLSRAAFPASSRTSAARYSITAAKYTGAPAPMRSA